MNLKEKALKQLLHKKSRWTSEVKLNLWPYVIILSNNMRTYLPDKTDGISPMERSTSAEVSPRLKSWHTFGFPVYALQKTLRVGGHVPRCNPRAILGLNLGPSPRHAGSVNIVLNLITGMVYPRFHVIHDNSFETVSPSAVNERTHS